MHLAVAADHAGFDMKQILVAWLQEQGHQVDNLGPAQADPVDDYPDVAAALENAKAGDQLLVANYGDGADAMAFQVTEHLEKLSERRGASWHLARRRPVATYDRYLKARSLGSSEWASAPGPGLSATIHHRERDDDLSLRGQRCRGCAAIQFPAQRVCETCFRRDDFEAVRLSDRVGEVVTYTFDYFFPTPDPPTIVTVTDIEGARIHLQLVNCTPEETRIGLPVEFTFRRELGDF